MQKILKVATRGSPLALMQFDLISRVLNQNGMRTESYVVKSKGDTDSKIPLYETKERGTFVKKLNDKILEGEVSAAVHSAKDIPYSIDEELEISYFSERGDPRDYFVSETSLLDFSGTVGSSSKRREAFLLLYNKRLQFQNLRGNIETRVKKWRGGEVKATVIAKVALDRLNLKLPGEVISEKICPPDPNQGFIAVVTRKGSSESKSFKKIQQNESLWEASVEREAIGKLNAGCSSAIGILGNFKRKEISISYANKETRYDFSFFNKVTEEDFERIRGVIDG